MKYIPFNIEDISTYRSELMGWSILWIMMLHFTFNQIKPLGFIAQYGFAGVDIFMFVSGLGLFYSLEKSNDILCFYKKRFLRIFPTYYLIGLFYNLLITHDDAVTFLFRYSTIGFWTGGIFAGWFIPSIIFLYILTPLFKMIIDQRLFVLISTICVLTLVIAYYFIDKEYILDREHFFLLYRIPAFLFGMVYAYWIKNEKPTKYFFCFLLIGIPFFIYFFPYHHHIYNYKYYSLFFLLPFFTLCFILLSKGIKSTGLLLRKMGQASLEIYLIQGFFFHYVINGFIDNNSWHDIITITFIISSILLGITVHWFICKIGINRV